MYEKINHSLATFFIPIVTSLVLQLLIGRSWKPMPNISQYCSKPTITYTSNSSCLNKQSESVDIGVLFAVWFVKSLGKVTGLKTFIVESLRHQTLGLGHITIGMVPAGRRRPLLQKANTRKLDEQTSW